MIPTREEATALLETYNQEPFHLKHAQIVSGVMEYFARELGYGEEAEFWGLVGLLHDMDFENTRSSTASKSSSSCGKPGWTNGSFGLPPAMATALP